MRKIILTLSVLVCLIIAVPVYAEVPFNTDPNFDETVIADEYDIKITASGLTYDNYRVEVELTYENNSSTDYSFICGSIGYNAVCINGYMIENAWTNTDVPAGMKANDTISFSYSDLETYGITEIADMYLGFYLTDEDYNEIYPEITTIKTDIADSYDYETDTFAKAINEGMVADDYDINYYSDETIYDQDGVSIILTALVKNSDGDESLLFEVENNSSEEILGRSYDVYVNGLLGYGGTWSRNPIIPGARQVFYIKDSTLFGRMYVDAFDLSEMGEIKFTYEAQDLDGNVISAPENITITIPDRDTGINTSGEEIYSDNDISIILKGLYEDESDYNDNINIVLLIQNNRGASITLSDEYGSLAVNGWMVKYSCYSVTVAAESSATWEFEMKRDSLTDAGISDIPDISDVEVGMKIRSDDGVSEESTLSFSF